MKLKIVQPAALLLGLGISAAAAAAVTAEQAWVRATAPGQSVAAGYMKLRSDAPAAVVEIRTPIAALAEIHEMTMQGGVMKMRRVERLPLPANDVVELKSGGHHIMFTSLTKPLKDGDKVPVTLVIERPDKKREEVRVDAVVRSAPPAMPVHEHHRH
ncbi:MAG: copper chaperone PCu(A)C [Rhodospirillaceae bacterium]